MKIVFDDGIFALLNHAFTVYAVPLRPVLNSYVETLKNKGNKELQNICGFLSFITGQIKVDLIHKSPDRSWLT